MKLFYLLSLSLLSMVSVAATANAEKVSVDIQSLLDANPVHFKALFNEAEELQNIELYWNKFETRGLKVCGSNSFHAEIRTKIGSDGYLLVRHVQTSGSPWECNEETWIKPKGIANADFSSLPAPTYAIKEVDETVGIPGSTWKADLVTSYQLIDLKTSKVLASKILRRQPVGSKCNCMQRQVDTTDFGTRKVGSLLELLMMVDSGNIQ